MFVFYQILFHGYHARYLYDFSIDTSSILTLCNTVDNVRIKRLLELLPAYR